MDVTDQAAAAVDDAPPKPEPEPEKPAEKPAAEPAPDQDRWAAFAPKPQRVPGRLRRAAARLGRGLVHEGTLAVLGALALAVLMTWPAVRYPQYTLPQDLGDPTLVAWLLSWPGHILLEDPAQLWHGNAFFPERWSYAFTDSLLGYAPAGLLGSGPMDAVLRYNIMYVLAHALAFLGAYALVRQLGAGRFGALVAGIAFAYAPWRLAQAGHLHVLSTGGIALALAMLARGHGWSLRYGFRPDRVRPVWIVAGWLVAAWQVTLGFGIGLVFGYVLAGLSVVVVLGWLVRRIFRRRRHRFGRIFAADLVGSAIFASVAVLMALPYLTVVDQHPQAQRQFREVGVFSPPLRGFLTAPAESWLWGSTHSGARNVLYWAPEMALLPGFALLALAAAGLVVSVWSVWARVLLAAGVVGTVLLAMGTQFLDGSAYRLLYDWVPGWDALRTPGRLIIWTTLLLGVLAAGAVTAFAVRVWALVRERDWPTPGPLLRLAALVPVLLVLAEGLNNTPHEVVPLPPAALATVDGPILVLPSDQATDQLVMLWSTDRFEPVVNGGSGFGPASLTETREMTLTFPDEASVSYLRSLGVETVVVLPDRVVGTEWEGALQATGDGFGVTREEIDGAVVFHLGA
ncbi:MAG: hypothetical protein GEV12_20145 [Micromonosporaceae bacterium]|nr:hypothetical protein [Micromonosporaceae bacterium]